MASLASNNPVKQMLEDIKTIMDASTSQEEKEEALEQLEMYCEDVDLANGELSIVFWGAFL